jgi:hypothetical protein
MEERLNDKKWRLKNSWGLLFAFIPYFDCLAFFYMGHTATRKSYTLVGAGLAAVWFVRLFVAGAFISDDALTVIGLILWVAVIILTLVWRGGYLKLLAFKQSREPERHPQLADTNWQMRSSGWMLWSICPGLGGLSLLHIGSRTGNRRWKIWGVVCLALTLPLCIFAIDFFVHITGFKSIFETLLLGPNMRYSQLTDIELRLVCLAWALPVIQLFVCALLRRDYLERIAPGYVGARAEYTVMSSRKWALSSSWWMLSALIPYCGGAGMVFAGIQAKKKGWIIEGVIITAAFIAVTLIENAFSTMFGSLAVGDYVDSRININNICAIAVWILQLLAIARVMAIREPYLVAHAKALGGYESAVDRELGQQDDFRRRMSGEKKREVQREPIKEKPTPKQPKPMKKKKTPVSAAPSDTAPTAAIDVNTCTQEELLSLPGISLADAKRAMDYREERGGFASVDEFVDVLEIKPHFAVQIFKIASSSPVVKKANDDKPVRRRIDI